MSKDLKKTAEEKKLEAQRKELIEQYNKENLGVSVLANEPATQEDIDNAKAAFEAAQGAFNKRVYTIADTANAERVANFLKNWNEKYATWEKDQWVGVVRFNSYITDFLNEYSKSAQDLIIDYGALCYLDTLMMRPFGVGLAAAKEMEAMDEEYNKILETIDDAKRASDNEQLEIKKLQEVWAAACAGFKLHYLTEEERVEYEQGLELVPDGTAENNA